MRKKYNKVLLYPGAKWRIVDTLLKYIPEHHAYVEPFFGSGALFFSKEPAKIETINDIDEDVVNLFRCVRSDPKQLADLIANTPFSRFEYEKAYEYEYIDNPYEKARLFLIRLWQSHGFRCNKYRVGWKSDISGREAAYAVKNWNNLPIWIIDAMDRLKNAQIECRPALDIMERYDKENVFAFLDPPYILNTRAGIQYNHEMADMDHEALLKKINNMKAKIMICGYENDMYAKYLKEWEKIIIPNQTASGKVREEVIWMNYQKQEEQLTLF